VLLNSRQVLTVDDVTLRVRTPVTEWVADVQLQPPTTSVGPATASLIDAITEDSSAERQIESISRTDEAAAIGHEVEPDRTLEVAAETESDAADDHQAERATESSEDELTIDWQPVTKSEPVADLECGGAALLPSADAPVETISSDECSLEEVAADLDRLAQEQMFTEEFAGDDDFVLLEAPTSELASRAEVEPWRDLRAATLHEGATQQDVDAVEASASEFYDELPVFRGNAANGAVNNDPASDDSVAKVADRLVSDKRVTDDFIRTDDADVSW